MFQHILDQNFIFSTVLLYFSASNQNIQLVMLKIIAKVICLFSLFASPYFSQAQGSLVTVKGMALNAADSSPVSTGLHFDKLPYYDDIGTGTSKADGSFEFLMRNGTSYLLRTRNLNGFEQFEEEIKVTDDGSGVMALSIYITPIAGAVIEDQVVEEPEELEELIRLENLTFARGSAKINPASFKELDEFINYLQERPNVQIQLEGHTDFAGNADANMRLSQARVDAVGEYMKKNGIKKNRVTTVAFGGEKPLTQERTDEAKAKNRRVEVRLTRK
jgi:outer membrane protein OmpA-like peptidoglycan-associated protein